MKRIFLIISAFITLAFTISSTTWYPVEHTCPVCNDTYEYQQIASYGSYIYQSPSKYQYVYWPLTESQSIYSCPNCHFSTYMWDFDTIPKNKIDTITNFLETVNIDNNSNDYLDIPITIRLEIAEDVYKILGREIEFWCRLYRVMGYHFDKTSMSKKAKYFRLQALNNARLMLNDTNYIGQEKEILFIIAAMHNFTDQSDSSLFYLEKASQLTYKNKNLTNKREKGLDEYLTDLIAQYKEFIIED